MTRITLTLAILAAFVFLSCTKTSTPETVNAGRPDSEAEAISNKLIGSWVQPIPIDENEVQGFTLKDDGTAESINMATLVYKRWWMENGKLVLVAESIGSGSSSIDTTKYEIANRTDSTLQLKDGEDIERYTKR